MSNLEIKRVCNVKLVFVFKNSIVGTQKNRLTFILYTEEETLEKNAFFILECV